MFGTSRAAHARSSFASRLCRASKNGHSKNVLSGIRYCSVEVWQRGGEVGRSKADRTRRARRTRSRFLSRAPLARNPYFSAISVSSVFHLFSASLQFFLQFPSNTGFSFFTKEL